MEQTDRHPAARKRLARYLAIRVAGVLALVLVLKYAAIFGLVLLGKRDAVESVAGASDIFLPVVAGIACAVLAARAKSLPPI